MRFHKTAAGGERLVLARLVAKSGEPSSDSLAKSGDEVARTLAALKQLDDLAQAAAEQAGLRVIYASWSAASDGLRNGTMTLVEAKESIREAARKAAA
jgi:hypothetical protein